MTVEYLYNTVTFISEKIQLTLVSSRNSSQYHCLWAEVSFSVSDCHIDSFYAFTLFLPIVHILQWMVQCLGLIFTHVLYKQRSDSC